MEKNKCKGTCELRNLKWDMKEKENLDSNVGDKRAIWGKKKLLIP